MRQGMETPAAYEPLSEQTLMQIERALGGPQSTILGLGDTNLAAGAGILGPGKKCFWLKDGRRVTVSLSSGALIASTTKESDPLAVPANRAKEGDL